MRKYGSFIFGTIILLAGSGCGDKDKGAFTEERFTVTRVSLRDVISQTGEVVPIVKVELKSEASGKIEKIYVKDGQLVKKGQKILEIDPYKLLTKKKKVSLSLQRARIQKELAERDYNDAVELAATGTISEKKLKDLKSSLDLAVIGHKQQQLEMDDINYQLRQTTIVSPMNGVITDLKVEEGEIAVSATSGFQSGTSIATIADISRLEVVTKIGEVDYVHLKLGQTVVLRPEAIENARTTGVINFIALNAKKGSGDQLGTFEVRIGIDSLIPGMAPGINVNAEFVVLDKKGVLGVPCHYVKKARGKATVMVAVGEKGTPVGPRKGPGLGKGRPGGKMADLSDEERQKKREEWKKKKEKKAKGDATLEPRQVKLGATDFRHYEILEGLQEGEVVVFKPEDPKAKKTPGSGGKRRR